MRYPKECKNVIDVTKAPYYADNTGKNDCTQILIRALDDVLKDFSVEYEKTKKKLYEMSDGLKHNVHIGLESGRVINGSLTATFPEYIPEARILYFPAGIYRVSDTVTYSLDDLKAKQWETFTCEMCRNIHFLGEDKETTIIRLDDHAAGFDTVLKPVISFNTASKPYDEHETTNCAMSNTIKDMTIDCGKGNDKAIGVYYISSNLGRMENVDIKAESGKCGIYFDVGSEGIFRNIRISGFDYGFESGYTSPVILENVDVSGNRIAGIRPLNATMITKSFNAGSLPTLELPEASYGRYYLYDEAAVVTGSLKGNCVNRSKADSLLKAKSMPKKPYESYDEDYVIVDDFGAVGDGVTDSTRAIQAAMDSGKPIVLFGKGQYYISQPIKIPKTVKIVDFMYGNLAVGIEIITGEYECVFDICEDSEDTLFVENLFTHEQMYGYSRAFGHTARRDVVFADIYLPFNAMYYNTVGGSTVYIDNCFMTSGSYAQSGWLKYGCKPVFSRVLPYEFHDQTVYANNLNIERGEIELLNDHSEIYIDGYKLEGPGCTLKSINGGKTQINLCNAGIWSNRVPENSLFIMENSEIEMCGVLPFAYGTRERSLLNAFEIDGEKINLLDIGEEITDDMCLISYYKSTKK